MPAAAVIPAPVAYIKVVAVKKLVVGFLVRMRLARGRLRYVSAGLRVCHPSRERCAYPSLGRASAI